MGRRRTLATGVVALHAVSSHESRAGIAPPMASGPRADTPAWWAGRRGRMLLLAGAVLISARVWARILLNYFRADDFLHLYNLVNLGPLDMILSPFGGHMLIVRNGVMAATFALFGLDALPYFGSVLVTHLACTVLVFLLADRMTEDARLAFLAAVLFGVAPTHAASLGWYSVYGYVLACAFTLAALWLIVPAPADRRPLPAGRALGAALLVLAASQSFGTGAAVALVLPVAALVLRPATLRRPWTIAVLCAVPAAVALAARVLFLRASSLNPTPNVTVALLESYFKDLTLVVPMIGHLAAFGFTTLVLGASYPAMRYPDAGAAAVLLCLAAAGAVFAVRGDGYRRRSMLALLCLFAATCGAIAFGRAAITHLARAGGILDGVRLSPRYYYQIHAIAAVMLALLLRELTRRWGDGMLRTVLIVGGACIALALWAWRTPFVDHYTAQRDLVALARRTLAEEIAGHPPGSVACLALDGRPDNVVVASKARFPGYAALFMLIYPTDVVEGRHIRFVSSDASALKARESGGRIASLLVSPEACPGSNQPLATRRNRATLSQAPAEGAAMMSNCSLYPLEPLDPAIDPAYADGPVPFTHRVNHAGEIEIDWPVNLIPSRLNRFRTISFETLEDELERNAEREEHLG